MAFFNNSEIIRNFTIKDYENVLNNKPEQIGEFNYLIRNNKIFLLDDEKKEYELIPKEQRNELIVNFYRDPKYTGGYKKIYNIIHSRYAGISRFNVEEVIKSRISYQQRQKVRKRKIVKPIITSEPFQIWQMDLIDFRKYKDYNDQYKYILVIIDLFSKYTYIEPLQRKKAEFIVEKLKKILYQTHKEFGKYPLKISSDRGKEFINKDVVKLLKDYNIKQVFSRAYTPQAQGQVERRNQDIKNIIFRYFIEHNTYRYIDIIEDIFENINNISMNNTTKKIPIELMKGTPKDHYEAKINIIEKAKKITQPPPKFEIGDLVRIALPSDTLEKRVYKFTSEIYKIIKINKPLNPWEYETYVLNIEKEKNINPVYSGFDLLYVGPPKKK